jgi:hypothetical protein
MRRQAVGKNPEITIIATSARIKIVILTKIDKSPPQPDFTFQLPVCQLNIPASRFQP